MLMESKNFEIKTKNIPLTKQELLIYLNKKFKEKYNLDHIKQHLFVIIYSGHRIDLIDDNFSEEIKKVDSPSVNILIHSYFYNDDEIQEVNDKSNQLQDSNIMIADGKDSVRDKYNNTNASIEDNHKISEIAGKYTDQVKIHQLDLLNKFYLCKVEDNMAALSLDELSQIFSDINDQYNINEEDKASLNKYINKINNLLAVKAKEKISITDHKTIEYTNLLNFKSIDIKDNSKTDTSSKINNLIPEDTEENSLENLKQAEYKKNEIKAELENTRNDFNKRIEIFNNFLGKIKLMKECKGLEFNQNEENIESYESNLDKILQIIEMKNKPSEKKKDEKYVLEEVPNICIRRCINCKENAQGKEFIRKDSSKFFKCLKCIKN